MDDKNFICYNSLINSRVERFITEIIITENGAYVQIPLRDMGRGNAVPARFILGIMWKERRDGFLRKRKPRMTGAWEPCAGTEGGWRTESEEK